MCIYLRYVRKKLESIIWKILFLVLRRRIIASRNDRICVRSPKIFCVILRNVCAIYWRKIKFINFNVYSAFQGSDFDELGLRGDEIRRHSCTQYFSLHCTLHSPYPPHHLHPPVHPLQSYQKHRNTTLWEWFAMALPQKGLSAWHQDTIHRRSLRILSFHISGTTTTNGIPLVTSMNAKSFSPPALRKSFTF